MIIFILREENRKAIRGHEMKNNKTLFLIIGIILFMVVGSYFIGPTEQEEAQPEETEETRNLKRDFDQLSIDHLNLQGEKSILEDEIARLNEDIFDLNKFILESDLADDFISTSAEMIHKEFEDDKLVIFYETEEGYLFGMSSRTGNRSGSLLFNTLTTEGGIDWHGGPYGMDYNFYGGLITDNQIQQVKISNNDEVHIADIVEVKDDLRIWYSMFDYESKSLQSEAEKIKVQALDSNNEVIWEEAFDGPRGG